MGAVSAVFLIGGRRNADGQGSASRVTPLRPGAAVGVHR
jgi:hypothetical protein